MDLVRLALPWRLAARAASWPTTSQQRACRNALTGSTELAERRRDLVDVEEFLAALAERAS